MEGQVKEAKGTEQNPNNMLLFVHTPTPPHPLLPLYADEPWPHPLEVLQVAGVRVANHSCPSLQICQHLACQGEVVVDMGPR